MKKLIEIKSGCVQFSCMHWKQCEKKGYANSYISNPLSSNKLTKKGSHTHVAVIPYFPDVSNEENLRNDFVKDICQLCSFLANRALPKHIKKGNLQTLIIPLSRRYGVTGNSVFFCKKNLDAILEEFPPDSMTFMGTVVSKTLLNKGFRYSFMEDDLEYHGYKLNVSPSPQQIMATDGVEIETAFEAFAKSMNNWWPRRHPQPELTYTQIKTSEELKDLVDKMIAFPLHKRVSMDYESMTLGGTDRTNKAVCVQFCWGYRKDQNFFIPLDHYESPIPHKVWKRELKRLFKNFLGTFVVFSAQFEHKITKMIGENLRSVIDLHNVWFQFAENRIKCTGLDELGKMTLKALVYEWFGWKTIYDREDLWQRSEGLLYEKPLDELARYACADSIVTWAIMEHFVGYAKEIGYWETLERTLRWCYNRTNRLLADMYETGFPVNLAWLEFLKWNKSDNPLIKEEKHIIEEVLPNDEAVIEANNILTEADEGMGRVSMLKGAGRTWVFSPNKPLHKRTLYCDVLKLEPVKFTKKPDPLGQKMKLPPGEYFEIETEGGKTVRLRAGDEIETNRGMVKVSQLRETDTVYF